MTCARPLGGQNLSSSQGLEWDVEGELDDKKIRLTEITVSTANATAKGLKNRIFSPGQGRRGSWMP
jgi:hypothetical protein